MCAYSLLTPLELNLFLYITFDIQIEIRFNFFEIRTSPLLKRNNVFNIICRK